MTTTNDCSGRGRHNAKQRWKWNIIAIEQQQQWHRGMSCWFPPQPVVGQHHSQEEGCGSKTLLSCSNVDNNNNNDDGANDNGWFQMNVPPLINKQCNASFRQTGNKNTSILTSEGKILALDSILDDVSNTGIIFATACLLLFQIPARLVPPLLSRSEFLLTMPSMGLFHCHPTPPLCLFRVILLLLMSHSLFLLLFPRPSIFFSLDSVTNISPDTFQTHPMVGIVRSLLHWWGGLDMRSVSESIPSMPAN